MLYDPKWEVETKPDVLSLEGLIAWLEKYPATRRYDYLNCQGRCLYGQYMAAHGIIWSESGASSPGMAPKERDVFCALVYDKVAYDAPHTFGAALSRARKALAR
jgi:hypothetical protein